MLEIGRERRFFPDAFKQEAVAAVRGGWQPSWGCRIGWCVPGCAGISGPAGERPSGKPGQTY